MASQRRKRRDPMFAAPIAGNSSWHLENRRPRFQALADPNSTSAQFSAGWARFTSVVLPTACLGGGVARKNAATQALTREICQRREEVRFGVQRSAVGVAAGLEVASPAAKPLADTRNAQGAASDSPPK